MNNLDCADTKKEISRSPVDKLLIAKMEDNIECNSRKIWLPKFIGRVDDGADASASTNTNSWFNHKSINSESQIDFDETFKRAPYIKKFKRCTKIKLILNKTQKLIINNWFNACITVYNETASRLRMGKYVGSSNQLFMIIRDELSEFKHGVSTKSLELLNKIPSIGNKFTVSHQVKIQMLNQPIKEACKNYAIGKKQIVHFVLENIKFNIPIKTLHLEKACFTNGTICQRALGRVRAKYDKKDFNFDDIIKMHKSDCSLKFDSGHNEYYLYVPTDVDVQNERQKKNENPKKMISIDLGIRTFATGITESSAEKICNNYIQT